MSEIREFPMEAELKCLECEYEVSYRTMSDDATAVFEHFINHKHVKATTLNV